MTRSSHPLVDLLTRLSASTSAAVAVNLADYVTDTARRTDAVAALREVARCLSCGLDVEACPFEWRDACAIVNSLPTHGEVMAMPGHIEAERREHPSEPPDRDTSDETCVVCEHPRSQHEASAWADRKCRAGAEDDHCDCYGFTADVAPPLPAGEVGSVEEWESPREFGVRCGHGTSRLTDIIRATVEDRDAAWLAVLRRILDEPDLRRLLLAHVERVSR